MGMGMVGAGSVGSTWWGPGARIGRGAGTPEIGWGDVRLLVLDWMLDERVHRRFARWQKGGLP
eukprot:1236625-Amorphochlora_amoeboformis.AAC.1